MGTLIISPLTTHGHPNLSVTMPKPLADAEVDRQLIDSPTC